MPHCAQITENKKKHKEETNPSATNNRQTKDDLKISSFLERPSAEDYGTNSSELYEFKYLFFISNIYLLLMQSKACYTKQDFRHNFVF